MGRKRKSATSSVLMGVAFVVMITSFVAYRLRMTGTKIISKGLSDTFAKDGNLDTMIRTYARDFKDQLAVLGKVDPDKIQKLMDSLNTAIINSSKVISTENISGVGNIVSKITECLRSDSIVKHSELIEKIKQVLVSKFESDASISKSYENSPRLIEMEIIKSNNTKDMLRDFKIDPQKIAEYSEIIGEKLGLGLSKNIPSIPSLPAIPTIPSLFSKQEEQPKTSVVGFTNDDTNKINELISLLGKKPSFFTSKESIDKEVIDTIGILKRRQIEVSIDNDIITLSKDGASTKIGANGLKMAFGSRTKRRGSRGSRRGRKRRGSRSKRKTKRKSHNK
jgi:hypothetical protein